MKDADRARHAAQHRRGLADRVEKGDPDAARAMLQHSMAAMRRAARDADEADALALQWMADALAQTLAGVPLARAVGLERSAGRPGHSVTLRIVEAVPIWRAVSDLAASLKAQGVGAPKREAVRRVGLRLKKSPSKIREACALVASLELNDGPAE